MNDLVLRVCLHAYPAEVREQDGWVILDLARDLSAKGGTKMMREAAGMLGGGLKARAGAFKLDLTTAPWRAALGRLTLPVAVAMLCLVTAYITTMLQPGFLDLDAGWLPVWAGLALLSVLTVIVGASFGRRLLVVAASFLVFALMSAPIVAGLTGNHLSIWSGIITTGGTSDSTYGIGVDVFILWTPAAILLPFCALFYDGKPAGWRRGPAVVSCLAVATSVILGLLPTLSGAVRSDPDWSMTLGGVFICVPLMLVAIATVAALLRTHPASETTAALLVAAACLPTVWLTTDALTSVLPGAISVLLTRPAVFWPLFYLVDAVLICLVIWVLLRHRRIRTARTAQA